MPLLFPWQQDSECWALLPGNFIREKLVFYCIEWLKLGNLNLSLFDYFGLGRKCDFIYPLIVMKICYWSLFETYWSWQILIVLRIGSFLGGFTSETDFGECFGVEIHSLIETILFIMLFSVFYFLFPLLHFKALFYL